MAYQYKLTWSEVDDETVPKETGEIDTKSGPVPHPVENCECPLCKQFKETEEWAKDKDYFQSVQEEYGYTTTDNFKATETLITRECEDLKNLLISKNRRYGDSALSRGNIFNMSPVVSIKARIEDKLNRLKHLKADDQEDVILDLLGYFILLRIAQKQEK